MMDDLGNLIWERAANPMARRLLYGLHTEGALQVEGVPRQETLGP